MHSPRCAAKVIGEIWRGRLISVCYVKWGWRAKKRTKWTIIMLWFEAICNICMWICESLPFLHASLNAMCECEYIFRSFFFSSSENDEAGIRRCLLLNNSSINFIIQRKLPKFECCATSVARITNSFCFILFLPSMSLANSPAPKMNLETYFRISNRRLDYWSPHELDIISVIYS